MGCYGCLMTPISIVARHAAVLLTLVALPMPLQADPITITGGMVEVDVTIADARIRLVGDDFLVRTDTDAFVTALVGDPFPTGTTLTLGGDWLFTGFRTFGEANVNGVHYPEVFFGLPTSGTFTTPSVTLTGGVEGRQTFTVPFTFNGVVTGFASQQEGPTGEQPLFTATLVGSGTARAAFFGFRVDEASPIFDQPVNSRARITTSNTCFRHRRRYRNRERWRSSVRVPARTPRCTQAPPGEGLAPSVGGVRLRQSGITASA